MAFRFVGMTALDQALDHIDHLRNVFGCARLYTGQSDAQCSHVAMIGFGVTTGNNINRYVLFGRSSIDFVINIGDIACIDNLRVTT